MATYDEQVDFVFEAAEQSVGDEVRRRVDPLVERTPHLTLAAVHSHY